MVNCMQCGFRQLLQECEFCLNTNRTVAAINCVFTLEGVTVEPVAWGGVRGHLRGVWLNHKARVAMGNYITKSVLTTGGLKY